MFIKEITIKEIHEKITAPSFLFLAGGIILLFILNAVISVSDYRDRVENYNNMHSTVQQELKQKSDNFSDVVFHRFKVLKKPSSKAFIAHAHADNLPNGMNMDFFEISNPRYFKPLDVYSKSFITLDWTNILFYLLSFLCLSLSYNALSGEKVDRTMQLIFSNQVPRASVIAGKFSGLFILVFIPVIIGIVIHIIIFHLVPDIPISGIYQFTGIFLLGIVLFIAINLLVGLFISALTSAPMVSMSWCLIAWLVFAVVIPGTGWLWSKQMVEIQSVNVIKDKIDRKSDELLKSDQYSLKTKSSWKGKAPNKEMLKRIRFFQKTQEIKNRLWHQHIKKQFQQTDHAIRIAKASPYTIFRFFGERISDNGYFGHKHFYHQVQNYHSTYKKFLRTKDKQFEDSYHKFWNESWFAPNWMSSKPIDYQAIPKFSYERPDISQTFKEVGGNIIYMLIWCIFLFGGTFIAFIRYDVR